MAAVVAQGGVLGPLVGAIDQGTSSTRFLVSATNHEERSLLPFESKASKPQKEGDCPWGGMWRTPAGRDGGHVTARGAVCPMHWAG